MRSATSVLAVFLGLALWSLPGAAQDFGVAADSRELSGDAALQVELIRGAEPASRSAAAEELGRRRVTGAAPILLTAAKTDPDPEVRRAVVHALAAFLDQEFIEEGLRILAREDPDAAVRDAALECLAVIDSDHAERAAPWSRYRLLDPDHGRLVYSHAAFSNPSGTFVAKSFNIGTWNLKYSINRHMEIGANLSVPVLLVHVGPFVKVQWKVNDWFQVGGFAQVHAIFGYEDFSDINLILYGGGPMLTFGNPDLSLTVTAFVHGHHSKGMPETWSVVPVIAGAARVHRIVKLMAEVWVPIGGRGDQLWGGVGELGILLYGIRIFGEKVFGDISFVWPFHEGIYEMMKYMPLGIPLLNFGFTI